MALVVDDLTVTDADGRALVDHVSFEVRRGEIVGVAGVQGNGQTELVEALAGLRRAESGTVRVEGHDVTHASPRERHEAGVAHIPEDRQRDGLVKDFTVFENIALTSYYAEPFSTGPVMHWPVAEREARRLVDEFDIRTPSVGAATGTLSGGNQQKVIVAREISRDVSVTIASQPTRGVDVGSIEYIHERIVALRDRGRGGAGGEHRAGRGDGAVRPRAGDVRRPDRGRPRPPHHRHQRDRPVHGWGEMTDAGTPEPRVGTARVRFLGRLGHFDATNTLVVPLLAVVSALIAGALIVGLTDIERLKEGAFGGILSNILHAYKALFVGAFGSWSAISETLVFATPLLLTGLAVALSFRSGLFNIGATGQMLAGGMGAVWVGFSMHGPGIVQIPLAMLAGIVAGGIWGGIIGVLKARTGAHEVITTIMANYIAGFLALWLLKTHVFQQPGKDNPISRTIARQAGLPQLLGFVRHGLRADIGILIAVAAAVGMWWMFRKSKLGFELRTVGTNADAARYAGMHIGGLITVAMTLSGALAGLAGAVKVLGTTPQVSASFAGEIGFDAIAVALLGRNSSSGTTFAALLFGALEAGKTQMQLEADVPLDLVLVLRALIVLFIAAPTLTRLIWRVRAEGGGVGLTFRGWGS